MKSTTNVGPLISFYQQRLKRTNSEIERQALLSVLTLMKGN